jgi:hypothetical protein
MRALSLSIAACLAMAIPCSDYFDSRIRGTARAHPQTLPLNAHTHALEETRTAVCFASPRSPTTLMHVQPLPEFELRRRIARVPTVLGPSFELPVSAQALRCFPSPAEVPPATAASDRRTASFARRGDEAPPPSCTGTCTGTPLFLLPSSYGGPKSGLSITNPKLPCNDLRILTHARIFLHTIAPDSSPTPGDSPHIPNLGNTIPETQHSHPNSPNTPAQRPKFPTPKVPTVPSGSACSARTRSQQKQHKQTIVL